MVSKNFEVKRGLVVIDNLGCDSGDALSGGGFEATTTGDDDSVVLKSAPNSEDHSIWEVEIFNHRYNNDKNYIIYAVCIDNYPPHL